MRPIDHERAQEEKLSIEARGIFIDTVETPGGDSLSDLCEEYRDDEDVVAAAVIRTPSSLADASERLQNSWVFLKRLIDEDMTILNYTPLKRNMGFVRELIMDVAPRAITYFPPFLEDGETISEEYKELALVAIAKDFEIFEALLPLLQNDASFKERAYQVNQAVCFYFFDLLSSLPEFSEPV